MTTERKGNGSMPPPSLQATPREQKVLQRQMSSAGDATASSSADVSFDADIAQSPAERRRVRQTYRELQNDLTEHRAEYVHDLSLLLPKLAKMDTLMEDSVKSVSETTLDSRVLLQAATIVDDKLSSLKLGRAMFDLSQYFNFVFDHVGEAEPDLDALGKMCGRYLNRAPVVDFMYGPLSVEVKKREVKQRVRLEQSQRTTVKPVAVSAQENTSAANETTPNYVNALYKILSAQEVRPPLYRFILNPQSFGQTIENLFYVSFLVRDGLAWVGLDDDSGDLVVEAVEKEVADAENEGEEEDGEDAAAADKTQWISAIDYEDWEHLCEFFGDAEPKFVPHRAVGEGDRDVTLSQYRYPTQMDSGDVHSQRQSQASSSSVSSSQPRKRKIQ
ncbi:hypothetical protein RI367_001931 [Sorochytrium milnesiophthora]